MDRLKSLLLVPVTLAGFVLPTFAAPAQPTQPQVQCLAPHALLTALTTAGDWIIKRDPNGVGDEKLNGIVFREAGMINVAVFQQGCLAIVVVIGKAPPDIEV